jgi:hypothetical protein
MNKIFYVACILHNLIVNSGDNLPYGTFDWTTSEWDVSEETE